MTKRKRTLPRASADQAHVPLVVCNRLADDTHTFDDNERGVCARCGEVVVYRPHVPRPHTLVCARCWLDEMQPDDEIRITSETITELMALMSRPRR